MENPYVQICGKHFDPFSRHYWRDRRLAVGWLIFRNGSKITIHSDFKIFPTFIFELVGFLLENSR